MSEFQRRLLSDFDPAKRSALEREFDTWRQWLKREMDAGVPRYTFELFESIMEAIDAAMNSIKNI